MADILEYLDWRGDITFEVDPFNEVDNLILAQMAYTDLEGVMTQDEELSIEEVSRLYFSIHTEEEVMARDTFFKLAAIVLKKASESNRFKGTTISRYINMVSAAREEQYSAVTYRLPNGIYYVAFRGTDNTIVGWKEDFNLTFMSETAGQKRAVEYIDFYFGDKTDKLILGGHSKGGNFAVYAGAFCRKDIQDRIINVYSNDGPGFRDDILEKEGYKNILPRVISILPEETIVGVLLSNEYENHIVASSAKGVGQHDPMTWQVYGRGFVEVAKRSEGSHLIDKTMMAWLATMNDAERKIFTDALFSSLDATGLTTLNEVSSGGIKVFSEIMKSLKSQPAEKQKELSEGVRKLLKIGSEMIASDVKKKAKIPKLEMIEKVKNPKTEIRSEIIKLRKEMTPEEVAEYSSRICSSIMELLQYQEADIILAYMAVNNEVNLSELIKKAKKAGKKVYIPKVINKKEMRFYLHNGRFTKGSFGISEPSNVKDMAMYDPELEHMLDSNRRTLAIIPGVAYDINRNRIGYGGGYYDRFLESVKDYPVDTVAVGYDIQIVDNIQAESTDIKPDLIITEKRIIS